MPDNIDSDNELQRLVDAFENYLDVTDEARLLAERDKDYVDHKQWTDDEVNKLEARGQAPVVINRIKNKVNLLKGVQRKQRTDPKALPRTPQHEDAADSATDALRFVTDNEDFEITSSDVFEDTMVWGYGAAIVEAEMRGEQAEIAINYIAPDRFYYDPFSRERDFSDAKFMGIVIWLDEQDAIDLFPDSEEQIKGAVSSATDLVDGHTFEDKPEWVDRRRKRIRICQHYYEKGDVWYVAFFTQQAFLRDPQPSNYLDEFGEPVNPIEAQSAYVDRDNCRYGEVRSYVWIQDEINHRRSKLLYNMSVRQTLGEKGSVDDVNLLKRELAKANGHVEVNPDFRFELLDTSDQTQGQFALYQESKAEIDAVGANAALAGNIPEGTSGRALQALQQGGVAELGSLFDGHSHWERRIYRQVWNRIKQFWDEERWIRVTDDEDSLKWVGLNQPVTLRMVAEQEAANGNQKAAAVLQAAPDDPRLNEVVDTQNNVAELDVDIILTQSPDYAIIQQEQFETLARLAQVYGPEAVPFETMVELSGVPKRKAIMERMKPDPEQAQAQAALNQMFGELELEGMELDNIMKEHCTEAGRD
jgi:hypothetical protein